MISLVVALVVAFGLVALAQDVVKGKVEALEKDAKKITISRTEYSLSNEAAQAKVEIGDEVEATVEGKVVEKLTEKKMQATSRIIFQTPELKSR